ncbi:MAG: exodeoxyribonuclease VII large subunit [Candidatus Berkiella sp.]
MFSSSQVREEKTILTVQQLNQAARTILETEFGSLWVKGELSGVKPHHSGHLYFTLKDSHSQIRCVMFRGQNRNLSFTPKDGQEVILGANVTIYEQGGSYQLTVHTMEEAGVGKLQLAFEALKAKLQKAGYFALERKRPLPRFPQHIGIITSKTAAALQDILTVLKRRYPIAPITLYHTSVQGKGAAEDIVQAIKKANRAHHDVLILARGGGSLEDLWCFNEEIVAHAIYESRIPIITGIGHEVDFTIADFVADERAPTPSVAAEKATPDSEDLLGLFTQIRSRLNQACLRLLQHYGLKLDSLEKRLVHPGVRLQQVRLRCQHLETKLQLLMQNSLQTATHRLAKTSTALNSISPLETLSRGYALVTNESGEVVKNSQQLTPGERVNTRLAQGSFVSTVTETTSSP